MSENTALYLQLLRNNLQERTKHNSQYSLRAFARFLELDPGELSRILSGQRAPSLKAASQIADKLRMENDTVREFFLSILEERNKRSLDRIFHFRQSRMEVKQD